MFDSFMSSSSYFCLKSTRKAYSTFAHFIHCFIVAHFLPKFSNFVLYYRDFGRVTNLIFYPIHCFSGLVT